MLLISILLGLVPLAGIAWIVASGTITTVDGLFESLIMLSLSGVFFLNAFWELRDRMADCPHALPVLVEHLVRAPAFRQSHRGVLEGRQASPPHPACAGTNWR